MSGEFEQKVALVTGAGSGIGRATALAFARRGARVVAVDRAEAANGETTALVEQAGGEVLALRADVSRSDDAARMVERTIARFGQLDFAVNGAGIGGVRERTADYPEEAWQLVLAVNLTGVWLSMKCEIPAVIAAGGGAIVNIASVAGVIGFPNHAAYAASKHGVIGLTRTAALEYARRRVRVNAVCPAFTRTPMVEALIGGDAERERKLEASIPTGRLGTPEEVAESILYLCSDAAAFVTGHALVLDGGLTAG